MQILRGGEKKDIIEMLRDALERAEAGEFLSVGLVWTGKDTDGKLVFDNAWATDDNFEVSFMALVTGFEVAKHDLMKELDK
jgi:hypothetical protein